MLHWDEAAFGHRSALSSSDHAVHNERFTELSASWAIIPSIFLVGIGLQATIARLNQWDFHPLCFSVSA
jgi:hypothetical protein